MEPDAPSATTALRRARADRRAHRQRAVARALRVAKLFGIKPEDAKLWAKHNADNLKPCSCWMCGHVRKWWGPPFREKKHLSGEGE